MDQFERYLKAAYPVVWISSPEPSRVERDLARVAARVRNEGQHVLLGNAAPGAGTGDLREVDVVLLPQLPNERR